MLYGVNGGTSGQEGTLYEVNKDLSVTWRNFIWCQKGLACYMKSRFMGPIRTWLLHEGTLFGINEDLTVTRMHFLWGQ